jgi:MFS family permease
MMKKSVKGNLLKASVLLIALQDVGAGATTPALGAIGAAFPNVSPTVIQNIATLPALFMVVFGLLYGPMAKVMNKRTILYVAVVCFLGGGIVPAFLNDIYLILGFRALLGVGVGLLYPLVNDLIVDFWEGGERRKLIGYAFAVGMFGGVLFQIIGGALSDISWHYTFYAYAVAAVFFIIPLIFLPEPAKKQDVVKGTSQEKAKVPPRQYGLCLLNTLWCICFTTIVANGAMVIVSEGIGTGSQIGVVFSVMTGGAFVGGILFGKLNKILGSFSLLYCYWGTAVGL